MPLAGLKRTSVLCLVISLLAIGVGKAQSQSVIKFSTEDGMTIYGTLHLPPSASRPVAGVILFAEPQWIVRSTLEAYGRNLAGKYGMAALTLDFRGNGNSVNGKLFEHFSPEETDNLRLDVRGAIQFLSSQKMVDPKRVGIVAVGVGTNYALLEASRTPAVQALVLISGTLSDRARNYIKSREDVAILCLAGRDDKEGFREMAEAFYLTKNKNSYIILAESGHGTGMFSRTSGLADQMTQWLAENLKGVGIESEVSFNAEDGYPLRGRVRLPDLASANSTVPGVILVHGANHDQDTYYSLTKDLAKKGIATLTYDWRGKNRELDDPRGHFGVTMSREDREKGYLDTKAAVNFLASQKGVDSNRLGIIGATAGSQQVFRAAYGDGRIQTIVILTEENLTDAVRSYVTIMDVPVFFIASTEDINTQRGSLSDITRDSYLLSKNKHSQLLLYDDAGRGSEMMKTKPELGPMIVRWFAEKLAK